MASAKLLALDDDSSIARCQSKQEPPLQAAIHNVIVSQY